MLYINFTLIIYNFISTNKLKMEITQQEMIAVITNYQVEREESNNRDRAMAILDEVFGWDNLELYDYSICIVGRLNTRVSKDRFETIAFQMGVSPKHLKRRIREQIRRYLNLNIVYVPMTHEYILST